MTSIAGMGLGLRTEHYAAFETHAPAQVQWLEIISENYMVRGGAPLWHLDRIRRDYPMVMHGVSMNLGGTDELDQTYLRDLKTLINRVQPAWVSDHLCWTGVNGLNLHDLMPVPCTEAALRHITQRVLQVQDRLQMPLVIENPSSYIGYQADEMPEWAFLNELTARTGCGLLLDVNNVYVSAVNHGFDAQAYIDAIVPSTVRQIHLAGHETHDGYLIDTHDHPVCPQVWALYEHTLRHCGHVPSMIERDDNIPSLPVLLEELAIAKGIFENVQGAKNAGADLECVA